MNLRKIKRSIFGFLSLSSALFVFQACYGTPQDFEEDVYLEGLVKSAKTSNPIQGIKVSVRDYGQYRYTDREGRFGLYTAVDTVYNLKFEDVDSLENGQFEPKDTLIRAINGQASVEIFLESK